MRKASAAFVALTVAVVALTAYLAFRPEDAGPARTWLLAAGPTVLLGGLAAAWARREDLLREWLSPTWGDFTLGVLGAILLYGFAWGFVRGVAPVGSPREIWLVSLYGQLGEPRVLQAHAPEIAAAIAVTALAEELLWRGAVTQMIAERTGSRLAWIWAAGLYALTYVPTAWSLGAGVGTSRWNPALAIAALGGGLLWGGMARRFGRLVPGVLAHALFDWAALMMFPLWGL
jgi:hypothetical protein